MTIKLENICILGLNLLLRTAICVTEACGSDSAGPLDFCRLNAVADCSPGDQPSALKPSSALPSILWTAQLVWIAPPSESTAGHVLRSVPAATASPAHQLTPTKSQQLTVAVQRIDLN